MDHSVAFKEFFEKFRVSKGSPFTHISRVPTGTYFIDGSDLATFNDKYKTAIKNRAGLTIAEKPTSVTPYHADFDFKLPSDYVPNGDERIYTKYVRKIIRFIQSELRKILLNKNEERALYCLLLEKKKPRQLDEKISDGFHLHFPFFICEPWIFEALRFKCMKYISDENMWLGVKFAPKFSIDNIVDVGIGKKMWHMYGSSKDGGEPYLITKAYNEKMEVVSLTKVFEIEMVARTRSVYFHLPEFMSVRLPSDTKESALDQAVVASFREKYGPKKKTPRVQSIKTETQVLEDLKYIQDSQFMEMLSDDRAINYDTWIEVGWALFNVGQGHDMALKMWDEFSRRCPEKYTEGTCEELWSRMEVRNMSMGTIKYLAKLDNPQLFEAWRVSNVNNLLERCLDEKKPTEYDVSKVIRLLYGDRFVCAESKKNKWYEFKNNRWIVLDEPLPLQKLILENVIRLFDDLRVDLARRQSGSDGEARSKLEVQENKCRNIISSLKTISFLKKVIEISKTDFFDPNFNKRRDENKLLFGCNNGVLDLSTGRFREGHPEDYITLSCGYDYKEYSWEDDDVKIVMKMMKKVFPNKNIRNYFLNMVAMALEGGNPLKKSLMCTGSGNNAKTKTFEFIEKVFGDYCFHMDTGMFIAGSRRKSNSAGPRPDLMKSRGRRIGMFQEIAKGEKLDVGVFKEMTGGDAIAARGMYKEEQEDIRPQMVVFSQFNDPPDILNDDAIWIRIRICLFEAKFVLPEQLKEFPVAESEKQQFEEKRFHADTRISGRFAELAPAFLWILFQLYKKCKETPIVEPEEVIHSTNSYKNSNDVFSQFITERIRDLLDPNDEDAEGEDSESEETEKDSPERHFITLAQLNTDFNEWYRVNHPEYYRSNKIGKSTLNSELAKRLKRRVPDDLKGKRKGLNKWFGYELFVEDDDKTELVFKLK